MLEPRTDDAKIIPGIIQKLKYEKYLLVIFALSILIWSNIFKNYIFWDSWQIIAGFSKCRNFSEILCNIVIPHNEHFQPLFKGLFYVEYRIFGLNAFHYHLTSLTLFLISIITLHFFLKNQFKNRIALYTSLLLWSTNSTYYQVIGWEMVQGLILCFIFILLSLIYLDKYIISTRRRYLILSSLTGFLAALSFGLGILAIPLVLMYFILLKNKFNINLNKSNLVLLSVYLSFWSLYLLLYYLFAFSKDPTLIQRDLLLTTMNFPLYPLYISSAIIFGLILPTVGILPNLLYDPSFGFIINSNKLVLCIIYLILLAVILSIVCRDLKKQILNYLKKHLNLVVFLISSILLWYSFLFFARSAFSLEAFIFWGRYHFLPFFAWIWLIGSVIDEVLSQHPIRLSKKSMIVVVFIIALLLIPHYISANKHVEFQCKEAKEFFNTIDALNNNYSDIYLLYGGELRLNCIPPELNFETLLNIYKNGGKNKKAHFLIFSPKSVKTLPQQSSILGVGSINGEANKPIIYEHPLASDKNLISFENITIPKNATLKFGIALDPQVWSPDKGDGVLFEICIKENESEHKIFSKYIDPKNNPEDRKWNDFEIDLAEFANKSVTILLSTSSGPKNNNAFDWAWWGEPIIMGE